jgi:adiponectin receptor
MYVIGALLYMARIPERLSPGTFDYFGASHQIFHVLILLAAASHYICIRRSYTFWHTVEALDGNAVCNAFESLRQCTAK